MAAKQTRITLPTKATKNKYGNRAVSYQGIEFDSMKEANRYAALLMLQRAGEISELRTQVPFELIPAQYEPDTVGPRGGIRKGRCVEKSVVYKADFVYLNKRGETVVEDTKGFRTADYIIKRKLMLFVHKIKIQEI